MPVRSASCAALALALLGGLAAILSISGQGRPALAEIAMVADMLVVEHHAKSSQSTIKRLITQLALHSTLSISLPVSLSDKECADGSS